MKMIMRKSYRKILNETIFLLNLMSFEEQKG